MNLYERFKRMTSCDEEELDLRKCCLELDLYIQQIEYNCRKARLRIEEILQEFEEQNSCVAGSEVEEELELPVEIYKLICEEFGEQIANKIYYDVKLRKLPLTSVEKYFLNK